MQSTTFLSEEKFQEIYTNEEFRNAVAMPVKCCYADGRFKHFETVTYPQRWIVTEEQSAKAKTEKQRARVETIENNRGKLLFVGMGCTYESRFNDDVCNHRIRTEFLNAEGKKYFLEFGTGRGEEMRIDHSIDRDLEDFHKQKQSFYSDKMRNEKQGSPVWNELLQKRREWDSQPYHNYNNLERAAIDLKYTLQNVLKVVNENFNCNFTECVVDNYNVSPDDVLCISPKAN